MSDTTPYSIPRAPGRWRAILFAIVMHLALISLLWVGIRWQSDTPIAIEAEIWSPDVREAAPKRPSPVAPSPTPSPRPAAKPLPQPPVAAKAEPKPVSDPPPVSPKPDIALARTKKIEEERARAEQQKEQTRIEKEQLKQHRAEEQARLKKEIEEEKTQQRDAAESKLVAKTREEEMRRIMSNDTGAGEAPKAQTNRADPSYLQKVGARIRSNTIFTVPSNLSSNPGVEYEVDLLPDGAIAKLRKTQSSGLPGFDEAVKRAIEKSQPYPRDRSGEVPSSFTVLHRPKEQ